MDTLAISNEREREEIALLVAALTVPPDGGELCGEIGGEERREDNKGSNVFSQSDAEM